MSEVFVKLVKSVDKKNYPLSTISYLLLSLRLRNGTIKTAFHTLST